MDVIEKRVHFREDLLLRAEATISFLFRTTPNFIITSVPQNLNSLRRGFGNRNGNVRFPALYER